MHREDDIDWVLVAKYLAGECTPDQRAIVERWAASSPEHRLELDMLRESWTHAAAVPSSSRVDSMWDSLSRQMKVADGANGAAHAESHESKFRSSSITYLRSSPPTPIAPKRTALRIRAGPLGALAAGLVIVAAGLMVWRTRSQPTETATPAPVRTYATARAQRSTFRLEDGTRVELGYASTLNVLPSTGGRRELTLEGEAVFDVVHDARRPFVVRAGGAVTEDLGTTFSVSAYPRDSGARVVVVSGKVGVRPLKAASDSVKPVELGAGQLVLVRAGRLDAVRQVDVRQYMSWVSGHVAFDLVRLDDVAADLERRFDVTIHIPDSAVAARRVFLKEMPASTLEDVLGAVTQPLTLHYRRNGGVIVVER
jgi:transmembrane sensor